MPETPLLSVVIPTLNREQPLCTTIEYFLARETYRPFELIVVDQSERHDPKTAAYLESVASRIRLERVTFKSLPKARNHGLGLAKGDIVVFVDDDVEPHDGFLSGHLAPYADPKVWMVTGPSPGPGEPIRSRAEITDRQYRDMLNGQMIGLNVDFDYEPCSWGAGCNISVRKSAAAAVGGFDEQFVGNAVGEDAEFCNRIRLKGGIIHYAARASLVHVQVASGGCRTDVGADYVRMFAYNQNYFFRAIDSTLTGKVFGNWQTYRRLVLNRYGIARLPALTWAFVAGLLRGVRQPRSNFSRS